jgi:enoyl-CoA hydratase
MAEGLRQFNERDHPDRRAADAPRTPGISRPVTG